MEHHPKDNFSQCLSVISTEFWALWKEPLRDLFLHFHDGICDKQDASSEGQKDESHLVIVRAVWWMLRHFQPNCYKQADICQVVCGFRTKWPSSWSSEEASWRSQMPNWWRSARGLLTVLPFTKHRILWWRHTFTDHVVTNARTFRVTIRRSSSFFSFLMTNVILNKNVIKQANIYYVFLFSNITSYIPIYSCLLWY
jgi:hypothetical protein